MSDRVSKFIQHEIDQINTHLPQKVLPLHIVQKMATPGMKTRGGQFSEFETSELERIKSMIPQEYWSKVLLPIIITRRRDLGAGAFKVSGSEVNLYVIQSLFADLPPYKVWIKTANPDKLFYRPHLKTIRKEYKTTSVIAFT